MQIAVVSHARTAPAAAATVRHALRAAPGSRVHVLDLDGSYLPSGTETVLQPPTLGVTADHLHLLAALLPPDRLAPALTPTLLRTAAPDGGAVLVLDPGVLLLADPSPLVAGAQEHGLCLVARPSGPPAGDGRHPDPLDLVATGSYLTSVLAVRADQLDLLSLWERSALDPTVPDGRWLDVAAARVPHLTVRRAGCVVGPGSLGPGDLAAPGPDGGLLVDGEPVVAVDLSRTDPASPWVLDGDGDGPPRTRLSEHPHLAGLVLDAAARIATTARAEPSNDLATTSLGTPVDAVLHSAYRTAIGPSTGAPALLADGAGTTDLPDPFDPTQRDRLLTWLTSPVGPDRPAPYLTALHRTREDLQRAFPAVPGPDVPALLGWVERHAVTDGYPPVLVTALLAAAPAPAPRPGRPAPGVDVVGFLRGELGIGESARLLVSALDAAGTPHGTRSVDTHLASRQGAGQDAPGPGIEHDTTVLCVNADLTGAVAAALPPRSRSYRIGMWYWEVEDFPVEQRGGFDHVDEVWVATDFVRAAIEPHSPVPVRTLTPPLPQRRAEPTLSRADLGLPAGFVFLFVFDYLSTAERKNPVGLVEAFCRAFPPGAGPVLVIKSINADARPAQAERLRLRAADRPDVLLLEDYLDPDARDALVAVCDCYVSLHRSEGLGLTMAEAMAWGKPVIATAYSGNLQFMTPENSFLVPWTPGTVPLGAEPYPAGGRWADPDLAEAARLMRLVVDDPQESARRGARAAADLATRHTPEVAGAAIAARLEEIAKGRRGRALRRVAAQARRAAGQLRASRP